MIAFRSLVIVALLSGCMTAQSQSKDRRATLLSYDEGLKIGREAAVARGYDLARYKLDTFGNNPTDDGQEWMFVYLCWPGLAPPGCSFMVVVDRHTGSARVSRGQ